MINELMAANLSIIIETLRLRMIFLLQIFQMIFRDRSHENLVIQINKLILRLRNHLIQI